MAVPMRGVVARRNVLTPRRRGAEAAKHTARDASAATGLENTAGRWGSRAYANTSGTPGTTARNRVRVRPPAARRAAQRTQRAAALSLVFRARPGRPLRSV